MADRENRAGLSIGQLVTLTFGFLVASALIFAFGFWVGYDAAQRRLARDQQIVRLPVEGRPPTGPARAPAAAPATALFPTPRAAVTMATPAPTGTMILQSTPTRAFPTSTPSSVPPTRTATREAAPTVTGTATMVAEIPGAVWTVQAGATTDPGEAVRIMLGLRQKGYDAYTVTAQVDGVMWYRVRVGRFRSRVEAKVLEIRLKDEEGMKDAFVAQQ